MSHIHVLDSEIINQIAAGEVVERPAHLIKELIENSLDAGADSIVIEISNGGKTISVKDNGEGIYSNELADALKRHATSKIQKTDDLWNLHSFGFRGEALASAAAVSDLTIKSVQKEELQPSQIQSVFGAVSELKPSSIHSGTEILIEDLFSNVPARLKFLKSDSTENQQIKTVIKAVALAHEKVDFKLILNKQLEFYFSKKKTKLERALEVFEKKELFETHFESGMWKCSIVYSSPSDVAKTSKNIWVFAQNRWIQDRAIQAAVMDAYRSLLMHGEYPFVSLWLECDPAVIDVNIHPTKSQVKFQDSSVVFRIVQKTLRSALEKASWLGSYVSTASNNSTSYSNKNSNLNFNDQVLQQTQFKNKSFSMNDYAALNPFYEKQSDQQWPTSHPQSDTKNETINDTQKDIISDANHKIEVNNFPNVWSQLQVIGQLNLTYIVCQKEDRLILVDQHAAHERVVYESLMQSWKLNQFEIQDYLFPLAIDLTEDQIEVLLRSELEIQKLGFNIERLGPITLGIKSAPALIKDSSIQNAFEKMAEELSQNGGSFAIEKVISDIFASMACHSVVRAGQSLSINEMQELLKSMDQFALSSFCPHGRPVSIDLTFFELEKRFGRIG